MTASFQIIMNISTPGWESNKDKPLIFQNSTEERKTVLSLPLEQQVQSVVGFRLQRIPFHVYLSHLNRRRGKLETQNRKTPIDLPATNQ